MVLVLAFRMPASGDEPGAGVRVSAQAPGELHVPNDDSFLAATELRPGRGSARGTLPVRNVTRGPVEVRMRVRGGGHDLDGAMHLELTGGGRLLASGPLARVRSWSRSMRLDRGAERTVRARAWIPAGATDTAARRADVELELDAELVQTRGSR